MLLADTLASNDTDFAGSWSRSFSPKTKVREARTLARRAALRTEVSGCQPPRSISREEAFRFIDSAIIPVSSCWRLVTSFAFIDRPSVIDCAQDAARKQRRRLDGEDGTGALADL